jgi:hypothetical protein
LCEIMGGTVMNSTLHRRRLILGGASAALYGTLPRPSAQAFGFSDVIAGAIGVGVAVFPPAALALAGFGLVKGIGLVSNANGLVDDARAAIQNLETHIDTVLNQVSSTLATVQQFAQDCDQALHDIETLVQQLPSALSAAFNAAQAQAALGRLQGYSANMSSYLNSKNSIITNHSLIQTLCDNMVNEISQINVLDTNAFQFVMHTIPSVTTWMQGYTAYNLLLDGNARSQNPWDHPVVSRMVLPKAKSVIQSIKDQQKSQGQTGSIIPLDPGVLYTFDGTSFIPTKRPFVAIYNPGQIDDGLYYTIWPDGVDWQHPPLPASPPGMPPPPQTVGPKAGDLVFLSLRASPQRVWNPMPPASVSLTPPPAPPGAPPFPPPPLDFASAVNVAGVYPRLLSSTLKTTLAFEMMSQGWQMFDNATSTYLGTSDKDTWTTMPKLT